MQDPKLDPKFAQRLDQALTAAGIPADRTRVRRVAVMFDVTRETSRLWTKGRVPGLETLRTVASRLQVSLDWLGTGRGSSTPSKVKDDHEIYNADSTELALIGKIRTMSAKRRRALLNLLSDD
ncbi:hypothetical protein [Tahibacter amnicola]|uniref:HTH cro/C1-type domain-containing protein n=1 Tax=Tahibacter amnicola TaxID=2976241 RepID=A0ABY6BF24_9GAMM|nr:hypothetical protein [Tahibacter amnicola]UXI68633.1 hypothetical protein N4264_02990 [Tahibacter amnicola]